MSERSPNLSFQPDNLPLRFFKACRWCRRQKMRCDARHQVPCFRCRSTGRNCILDPIDNGPRRTKRRRRDENESPRSQIASSSIDQRTGGLHHMPGEGQDFSIVGSGDVDFDADSLPNSPTLSNLHGTQNEEQERSKSQQLTPNEMMAPVSAVHSISEIFLRTPTKGDPNGDIIARGIVNEELARVIYERFINGSKNFLPLFDPIRDTFDSIRSRSLFCFTVIIYLASRAVLDLRSNTHMQRVLQDEAQRLAEDSFFERPTKLETVQGMILLAAYSEKTWFSIALILRTALDSGLEKSLDTLLSQENIPRSSISASMEERQLVWQTRTWLISFTLELDVASGTGRKSRIAELDPAKLRKFLDYPLSLAADMRTVSIFELHQLRGHARVIIENTSSISDIISRELPAIMAMLQEWWTSWDQTHDQNGFHANAFQRSSLKLMLHYARIFVFCISLARIQKLQPTYANSNPETIDEDVMDLWRSLVTTIMDQLAFLINESSYRYQLTWAPTYPALTVAFVTTFALRIARWCPSLIDQSLLLERAEKICDFLKQPPYPDIHRTVSIFVNYARALIASQRQENNDNSEVHVSNINDTSEQGEERSPPSYRRGAATENLVMNPPSIPPPPPPIGVSSSLDDRSGQSSMQNKEFNMMPADLSSAARPPPAPSAARLPDTMDAPNWTMSNSIADSFGLFEDGQNDIFDFLPTMPTIP